METGDLPANLLLDQRDALVEELALSVTPTVPFYASLSADMVKSASARIVDLCLASLREDCTEAVQTWGVELFSRRSQQGVPLAAVLRALGLVRRILCRAAGALEPDALAEDVIARLESVVADLVDVAVASYERDAVAARAGDDAAGVVAKIEARYRDIYQRTPAMMHSIDAERRLTAVSNRWLEVTEYTADEVLGRRSAEFLTADSRRRSDEINIPRLYAADELFDVPYQLVAKSGKTIDVRASSVVVRDDQGKIAQLLTVFEDVTAELEATHARRESEQRWRALIELSPVPFCVHRDGVILWMNEANLRLLGATSEDELLGRNAIEFVHPDDRAMVIARLQEGTSRDASLPPLEERFVRLDGKVIYVEVTAQSVIFEGQRATQTASIDITARKQAEEARRLSETQAQIIEAQEESLRALSTPLIPLGEGILVLPLVGRVTADRADRIVEALSEGVVAQRARVAIVDVTGVPEADASFAEALVLVAKSIRLLGAEVVITGMTPPIARALVTLGADLGRLMTCGTLRDGIAYARGPRRSQ